MLTKLFIAHGRYHGKNSTLTLWQMPVAGWNASGNMWTILLTHQHCQWQPLWHQHHHRLDNDNCNNNQQQKRQWQLGLKMHFCLEPQLCFLFFGKVLTSQCMMPAISCKWTWGGSGGLPPEPSPVSFLLFFTLLMIIYKQITCMEQNGNHNSTRGSWGTAMIGTTVTTVVDSQPQERWGWGTNETSNGVNGWDPLIIIFFLVQF